MVKNLNDRWYFFYRRVRKYENVEGWNRRTNNGCWGESGNRTVDGVKKRGFCYEIGPSNKGQKTDWYLYEYASDDTNSDPSDYVVACLENKSKTNEKKKRKKTQKASRAVSKDNGASTSKDAALAPQCNIGLVGVKGDASKKRKTSDKVEINNGKASPSSVPELVPQHDASYKLPYEPRVSLQQLLMRGKQQLMEQQIWLNMMETCFHGQEASLQQEVNKELSSGRTNAPMQIQAENMPSLLDLSSVTGSTIDCNVLEAFPDLVNSPEKANKQSHYQESFLFQKMLSEQGIPHNTVGPNAFNCDQHQLQNLFCTNSMGNAAIEAGCQGEVDIGQSLPPGLVSIPTQINSPECQFSDPENAEEIGQPDFLKPILFQKYKTPCEETTSKLLNDDFMLPSSENDLDANFNWVDDYSTYAIGGTPSNSK